MKISVVIPAHNEAQNIGDTIHALLVQDHPDFEIIVVDNASTDGTADVVQKFITQGSVTGGPTVKVVREDRKGLLWARERGRNEAAGELIANVDADCLPETDWLSRAAKHFEDERIVAVAGPYDYYDGGIFFRNSSLFTQRHLYYVVNGILRLPFVKGGAILIGGNNLIRARVLKDMGGYNTALTFYGEDTDTAKRVSRHGRVVFDKSLTMKTSARRFKAQGTINLMLIYWWHFFKQIFSRKN